MKLLLDTNAYVGFKQNIANLVEIIAGAERILFSPVVLGELMFGFRNGAKFKENMKGLDGFLQHDVVEAAQIGKTTSDRYSRIAAS